VTPVRGSGASVAVVTDRGQAAGAGRTVAETVAAALAGGAGIVLLREKDLPAPERRDLAVELRSLTAARGATLYVAGDAALAAAVGADGVHLASTDPWPDGGRLAGVPWGRSCHTPAELALVAARGGAWTSYSPVYPSTSKPGYGPVLGLTGLAAGCRAAPGLSVIALGGIGPGLAAPCVTAGAAGVAVMGAVMAAADPTAVVAAVLDELRASAA
jgi:thiamine-phosphate pyrophosphorylase